MVAIVTMNGPRVALMFLCFPQVTAQVRRIEAVEKDLKALSRSSASKDDLSRVRAEVKKLYDGLQIGTFTQCVLGLL